VTARALARLILALAACALLVAPSFGAPSRSARAVAAPRATIVKPVPGRNLLVNPGFEERVVGHAWMPVGWDTLRVPDPASFFGRDTLMVHGGKYSVDVANVSTIIPFWHNWSQTVLVGPEMWGKDVVFSVWSRSNGVQGRGYVLVQAFRDTLEKMGRIWNVPREIAAVRLGYAPVDAQLITLGWNRKYFSDETTDWVRREVRVFIPPSTNVIIVRCGLYGVGQMLYDDASLTAEPARPPAELPVGTNLLADSGFEGDGNLWEYSLPPYPGMHAERDTTVKHGGASSMRVWGGADGDVPSRSAACQVISNRALAGKRVRLSAWLKTVSLGSQAYIKVFSNTLRGDIDESAAGQISGDRDWTQLSTEVNVPPDAFQVWAWLMVTVPSTGDAYFDDVRFEVVGPAPTAPAAGSPATPR
jgi:hypothetical protein